MFSRSKSLIALSTLLLATALVTSAGAGEHRYRIHRIKHVSIRHVTIKNAVRIIDRRVIVNADNNRLPYHAPGDVNAYSGGVDVYSSDNVGSWSYGRGHAPADLVATGTTLKIVDMTKGKNDCSMEHGVCVIRP
jgi:hypothetical protein